jgi:hypothetical protein
MSRRYFTALQHLEMTPGFRLYLLMTPRGKIVHWKPDDPAPEGRFALLGGID